MASSQGFGDDPTASFIGALISLTSQSKIRYQGVLASIDPAQATLSLENVRSFGTEGRCAAAGQPLDEVPGNDNVYDYVVFRAADVLDLRIDGPNPGREQSAAQTPAQAPVHTPAQESAPEAQMNAPAYAQYYPNPYDMSMYPPHMAYYGAQMYMPPGYPQGYVQGMYPYMPVEQMQGMPGAPGMPAAGTPGAPGQPGGAEAAPAAGVPAAQAASGAQQAAAQPEAQPQAAAAPAETEPSAAAAAAPAVAPAEPPAAAPAAAPTQSAPAAVPAAAPAAAPAEAPAQAKPARQREPRSVPGAAPDKTAASKADVPRSDFDFESANALFRKERDGDGRLDAIPPAASSDYYNKKSGFFDNISSEVKDRHESGRNRTLATDERAKNVLTFGESATASADGYRRGGRRGGGPRRRGRGNNKPEWA
ncbi:hypothetical protein MCUN1_001391 [Malassezia cuniculi]|uniref:FFD box profile domain-containing protein n=1 Tax=Malassezia cuniculi TaxID=948313 RepID=A0AAF0ESQ3_9BASI|nr:hypothetical protein MCUN1_001391 [Malassezia cuniculi]